MALAAGTTIGRYTLERMIGSGGAGEVYSALDAQLDRRVALKLLRASAVIPGRAGSDPESDPKTRILREARAAAALDHPNCVAIFDVGSVDLQGLTVPWLAMELVDGRSLRAILDDAEDRRDVSLDEKISWLGDLARALNTAHARGMIHRDVKPENVMIRRDGVLKVLDFGVAKRLHPRASPRGMTALGPARNGVPPASVSSDTFALGTVAYMAPEQVRGDRLDGRTDQFAWGVLAYELLTGELPWPDPSDPVQYVLEMMASEPKMIRELAPEVPEHLEQAVHRALSKEPGARFATMGELLAALGLGTMRPREMSLPPSDSSAGTNRLVVSTPNLDVAASLVRHSLTSAPNLGGNTPLPVPTGTTNGFGGKPSATWTTVLVSTVVVVAVAVAAVMFRAYF
jgi:serine/threonine-protein kinase